MKKVSICVSILAAIALVDMGPLATTADAFDTWSISRTAGNCANCHGNFRFAPYIPLASQRMNLSWSAGLHDSHRLTNGFLNGNCAACHSGTSRFPVLLNASDAGTPFNQSCNGCHSGPGTRNHHEQFVDPGLCSACHGSEAIGNEKTPLPVVYTAPIGTTSGTTKINNPCNDDATGRVFEGSLFDVLTVGLDNDGDGLYDQNDPDCVAPPLGWGTGNTAEASLHGSKTAENSRIISSLTVLLIPVGAVILLRTWRRRKSL